MKAGLPCLYFEAPKSTRSPPSSRRVFTTPSDPNEKEERDINKRELPIDEFRSEGINKQRKSDFSTGQKGPFSKYTYCVCSSKKLCFLFPQCFSLSRFKKIITLAALLRNTLNFLRSFVIVPYSGLKNYTAMYLASPTPSIYILCPSRFVMSNLNISGRRVVSAQEVDEMIAAVDDGDGKLDFGEFVELIQRRY